MPVSVALPREYEEHHGERIWAFALAHALPWLEDVLASGQTLHGWASGHEDRQEMVGRGRVYSIPAPCRGPDGSDRWVIRHYYRGGALARYLGDRYLAVGDPRPAQEARAVSEARERGISTPSVVAGAVYRDGVFYRADMVTEEISGAVDLAGALFEADPPPIPPEEALVAAGVLVRSLERAGVFHPDLNAKNIVLKPGADGPRAHLVDLDRCCPRVRGVPAPAYPMRRRLERSLRKLERRAGRFLPSGAWSALHRGFETR